MATTLTTSYQRISTISVTYGEIRTYAKYNSQSIDNNTTTISLKTTYYLSQWISFSSGTSTLDGTSKSYGSTRFNAGETTLQEFTRTLNHNADGTSPTKTVATSWTATFGGGGSTSASVVAPTIPRASQPSINTWPNNSPDFNIGDTITIHMNRKSSSFTHRVVFKLNNFSYTIAASGVTNNVSFNTSIIADDIYAQIPNSTVANGTIEATTYNGSTVIGTKSCPFSAKAVNVNPTFDVSYQDTNSTTTAITNNNQKIIRNNSTLQINGSNLSAKKSSSLSSIKAVLNGVTYNGTISGSTATFNIGTLNVSSNTTAAVTLTDSRGLKTTQNLTIQVLDWALPSAIITAKRENNFYDPTTITVDGTYSSMDNLNTLTIRMRTKKTTDSSYGADQTLQDNTPETIQLDNNYDWNVQVELTDRLGTKTYNLIVERGIPIAFFDRKKRSLSIEKFPANNNSLEVAGDVYVGTTANNNIINVLEKMQARPRAEITNANITHKWENDRMHMQLLPVTSSMTSNKPANDGYILHCSWDNSGQWIGQLFIPNRGGSAGAPLQFRGNSNGTWSEWETLYREKVLYNNTSGTTGNITLSETAANFTYLEVYYQFGGTEQYASYTSSKIFAPNGKKINLDIYLAGSSGTNLQFYTSVYQINGTAMTLSNWYGNGNINNNAVSAVAKTAAVRIVRVVGYR